MMPCRGHSAAGEAGLGAGAHLGHAVVGPEVPGDDVVSAAAPLLPAQQLPGLTRQRGLTRPPLFILTHLEGATMAMASPNTAHSCVPGQLEVLDGDGGRGADEVPHQPVAPEVLHRPRALEPLANEGQPGEAGGEAPGPPGGGVQQAAHKQHHQGGGQQLHGDKVDIFSSIKSTLTMFTANTV